MGFMQVDINKKATPVIGAALFISIRITVKLFG